MKWLSGFFVASVLLLDASAASAQYRGSSPPDPYTLRTPMPQGIGNVTNVNVNVVSLRPLQTPDRTKRNIVIIGAGQSNMANSPQASVYAAVNAGSIDQLYVENGGVYNAPDPLLGNSINNYPSFGGGNPILRVADALITAGSFDHALVASIAIDGSSVADWETGSLSQRLPVVIARLKAKGWLTGPNVIAVLLWGQGETDQALGTTTAAYLNSLSNVITATRRAGFNGPWFVAVETFFSGPISVQVQNAQIAIVNHAAGIWAGPFADNIIGSSCGGICRPDNLHFGDLGMPVYVGSSIGWLASLHAFGAPFP
jgi:hypothetical protein